MKNTTHRVVILKNINSEIISQAILILKDPESVSESAVLAEAERIVEKYMNRRSTPPHKEKSGRSAAIFISAAAILFTGLWVFALIKIFK